MDFDVSLAKGAGPGAAAGAGTSIAPQHALGAAFILCLAICFLKGPGPAAAALGLAFCLALARQRLINAGNMARALASAGLFLAFLWLTLPLGPAGGDALFSLGPLHYHTAGLKQALVITFKAIAVLLAFTAFLCAYSFEDICLGLRRLRFPEKLITLLRLALRHIFTLAGEWRRLVTAAKLRGFRPGCNMHTYRTAANLLGMLLVRTHSQGERIGQAMLLRGFSGVFPALWPESPRSPLKGWLLLASASALAALLLFFDMVWT